MSVSYPNQYRNYCVINLPRRRSIEEIKNSLENPATEEEVIEDLYELNLMLDEGNKEVAELYPTLSNIIIQPHRMYRHFLQEFIEKQKFLMRLDRLLQC